MAFVKKTWKDRIAEFPTRRRLTKSNGDSELVTVAREEGTLSQEGDAFSAENMNDLERRVDDAISEINSNLSSVKNYSTEETVVGKWIDNKPIYSKTFSIVNPSSNQIIDSDKTKKLIKIEAFGVGNNGYTFVIPYAGMDTDIYATPNGLLFRTNDTWTGFTLYVTYYYTKD